MEDQWKSSSRYITGARSVEYAFTAGSTAAGFRPVGTSSAAGVSSSSTLAGGWPPSFPPELATRTPGTIPTPQYGGPALAKLNISAGLGGIEPRM